MQRLPHRNPPFTREGDQTEREEREQDLEKWKEKRREQGEREDERLKREKEEDIFGERDKKLLFWFCKLLQQILNGEYYCSSIVYFFTIGMSCVGTFLCFDGKIQLHLVYDNPDVNALSSFHFICCENIVIRIKCHEIFIIQYLYF